MSLESLLKSVKWLDKQVLVGYTKLSKDVRHGRRCVLAGALHASAAFSLMHSSLFYDEVFPGVSYNWAYPLPSILHFLEFNRSGWLIGEEKRYMSDDGTIIEEPFDYSLRKIANTARLPFFIGGICLMGKGIFEIADYVMNSNSDSIPYAGWDLFYGYQLFSYASSVYIKDIDPKLLQKEPFLKRVYADIKERVTALAPKPTPIPEPVPVVNYKTII